MRYHPYNSFIEFRREFQFEKYLLESLNVQIAPSLDELISEIQYT